MRIIILTSVDTDWHGIYKKESEDRQILWWQYYLQTTRTFYLFGLIPILRVSGPRMDEQFQVLLRKALED